MNIEQALSAVDEISRLAFELSANEETLSPQEHVELYAACAGLVDEVAVCVRSLRQDAVLAMHDMGVAHSQLLMTSRGGVVMERRNVGKYTWRGWELCDALAQDRVDIASGEVVRAVDVETLRAVVPACASEQTTSSRWNAGAVKRFVEVERYRDGEPVYEDTLSVIPKAAL